uniref:Uncharacterized protein n=1 Tax=Lactuca sativa TaxID=4236 RepID=A0A9R1VR90_LACSA|nr:hypothetical protein LSAT_V11C400218610 [Lactuca sativa]
MKHLPVGLLNIFNSEAEISVFYKVPISSQPETVPEILEAVQGGEWTEVAGLGVWYLFDALSDGDDGEVGGGNERGWTFGGEKGMLWSVGREKVVAGKGLAEVGGGATTTNTIITATGLIVAAHFGGLSNRRSFYPGFHHTTRINQHLIGFIFLFFIFISNFITSYIIKVK